MKKKILGFALVAMSFVGFTAMAQTTPDPTAPRQENVREKKADKKERRQQVNPFEGMTLTDSQQAQLQQLDSKRQADRAKKEQVRKDDRQRRDSARIADRRAAKKSYLEEVKAILTPDQYVVFLENIYVNGGGHQHGKASFRKGKDDKNHAFRQGREDKGNRRQHASRRNAPVRNAAVANPS